MDTFVNLDEDTKMYLDEISAISSAGKELVGPAYLSTCPKLPATAPIDHPHLIDDAKFNHYTFTKDLRLCDGVATVLWNFDQEAFSKFFDKDINDFTWVNMGSPGDHWCSFIVRRQGSEVLTGMFYVQETEIDWEWYIKSEIDFDTGKWEETWAGSGGTSSIGPDGPYWDSYTKTPNHWFAVSQGINPGHPRHARYAGGQVARAMMTMRAWDETCAYFKDRKFTWKAECIDDY